MRNAQWNEVDEYFTGHLAPEDAVLRDVRAANIAAGLPPIEVTAPTGKMLGLIAQIAGAKRILEIGTLGGYSTIWLARSLPEDGQLVTLELDAHHAATARANFERAELTERIELIEGPAAESLETMITAGTEPFDVVFVDADKQRNAHYVERALELVRPGAVIVVDNVVRDGRVLDRNSGNPAIDGTRRCFDLIAKNPRLDATALQTVGAKGWDGFILARVTR